MASQLEALRRAECHKVFSEQISTRNTVRPELEKALALARQFKGPPPRRTVHELKRLARNAAELMTLSAGPSKGRSSPRPRATTADGRRSSTTTC
ncbi:recombinase family protein [Streptomyces flaveolus]|uniref:recombinase family protein n=1 Tax=Streptomyces flaveolus TaxID=67297 RepID=UPI003D9E2FC9